MCALNEIQECQLGMLSERPSKYCTQFAITIKMQREIKEKQKSPYRSINLITIIQLIIRPLNARLK